MVVELYRVSTLRRAALLLAGLGLLTAACSPAAPAGPAAPLPTTSVPGPAGPAAPPPTPLVPGTSVVDGAGFSEPVIFWDSDADLATQLNGIAATGAGWLRIDVGWGLAEWNGPGVFDWSLIDRVVAAARARNLSILGVLDATPPWARPAGTTQWYPPTNPADFATFAQAAVQHFATPQGGASGPAIQTWEIWNEPNNPTFWTTGADPVAYTALLIDAYNAIKAVDPGATVITGGTAPASTGGGWMAPVDFLEGIYSAGGGGHFDAVACHPYNWPFMPLTPEANYNDNAFGGVTPQLHNVMAANGDGSKPIWGTEMGAPVPATRQGITTTPQYLASYITQAYSAWRSWSWTGPLIWYSYRDQGTQSPDQVYGLVDVNFVPKEPALAAFISAIAGWAPAR